MQLLQAHGTENGGKTMAEKIRIYGRCEYLTSTSYDEYLVNTLQLNAQSRVLHPTDKLESLYVRLVEDK